MEYGKNLTPEEKIKIIREAKNIRQIDLAQGLGCSHAVVSRAENPNDNGKYSEKHIIDAKKYLNIEKAPLYEKECALFRRELYVWRELIKNEHMEDARKKQKELGVIKHLPFEPELNLLYDMIEIRLLFKERKFETSSDYLSRAEPLMKDATAEILYEYYYNRGSQYLFDREHEDALRFLTLALELEVADYVKEPSLNYNIALCHARFGRYFLAIIMLERAYLQATSDEISAVGMVIENNLGLNYLKIGNNEKAKEHFENTFERAKLIRNERYIGNALHNKGCVYFKLGKYKEAIVFLDQAEEFFEKGDIDYLENQYRKIRCLIAMNKPFGKDILQNAIVLAEGNEYFTMIFEALSRIISAPKDNDTLEYVENTVIPYFMKWHSYNKALEYYDILEKAYKKRSEAKTLAKYQRDELERKILNIGMSCFDIYKKMIGGEELV